jgi:hypothetical protein
MCVALFQQQSSQAQAQALRQGAISPGISLEIRAPTNVLKVGDLIPIQFIISNQGTRDFNYVDPMPQLIVPDEVNLVAKTASGEVVPKPKLSSRPTQLVRQILVLHPGQSFAKSIPLNFWALIKEPGRYQVQGTYLAGDVWTSTVGPRKPSAPLNAAPITITVLPRTLEEMDDYIKGLTNQLALALELAGKTAQMFQDESVLDDLFLKLMFTCNPKAVPTLLHLMDQDGPRSGDWGWWVPEALSCYVPRTKETWQIILDEVARHGLNHKLESLLAQYDFNAADMKPIIERALAVNNVGEWRFGAMLAANTFYDDAFTSRLITIALDSNAPPNYTDRIIGEDLSWNTVRAAAISALALNRTDAGVKALRSLLNDPDPQICVLLCQAIMGEFDSRQKTPTGRHLQPEDFTAQDVRPMIERMLASTLSSYQLQGLSVAEMFPDDSLTPKLVALATNSELMVRTEAINALALNRTDDGVKTLKMLLDDPDRRISSRTQQAIHEAYTSRGDARGRPLRADDFDAKFRDPGWTPSTIQPAVPQSQPR